MISKLLEEKTEGAPEESAPEENASSSTHDGGEWQGELNPKITMQRLFEGWDGMLVMSCGVILPALMLSAFSIFCLQRLTLIFFDHPLETLTEYLLVALIPITTFMVWSSLRRNVLNYSLPRAIAMGAAVGASAIVAAVATCGAFANSANDSTASTLLAWIIPPALLAFIACATVVEKVRRTRDFASSRKRVVMLGLVGMVLAFWSFVGAEGKSWYIRLAEIKAASSVPSEQKEGMTLLRALYPEREMRIQCTDARAAGLAGLFLPLSNSSERELYFAVTGEPFGFRDVKNDNLASLSDESLARQIVGESIPGLSMLRSSMNGTVRPDFLLSTISWTFVFKNESSSEKEARAEIAVPQGAVVNQLTLWNKGEPKEAEFIKRTEPKISYTPFFGVGSSTAAIKDVGHGRLLISCAGVPPQGELKLRMSFVIPLKSDGATTAALTLPKFIATNFNLTGDHEVRLRSSLALFGNPKNLKLSSNAVNEHLITGALTTDNLVGTGLTLTSARLADSPPIAFEDNIASFYDDKSRGKKYVVRTVEKMPSSRPSQLVVVVDGSNTMEKYRTQLITALKSIPSGIPTSVILASTEPEGQIEPHTLTQSLVEIQKREFAGGQNNLVAMIKAAEVAGETKGSAVLWIHGPQPESNREIYIMGQYEARPSFYDFPIQNSYTDTAEFFRNYSEVGPFEQVPTSGAPVADLGHFFSRWNPGSFDYKLSMEAVAELPKNAKLISEEDATDVVALWAGQECAHYSKSNDVIASEIGVSKHLVTPGSDAYCSVADRDSRVSNTVAVADRDSTSPEPDNASTGMAPSPEDADKASTGAVRVPTGERLYGINNAGTVRVNNIANLEAFLNLLAACGQIFGVAVGLAWFVSAMQMHQENVGNTEQRKPAFIKRGQRITLGGLSIVLGLMSPGAVNWLVASARDANLFS
jgi:hypothetical protein